MRKFALSSVALCAALLAGAQSFAQTPPAPAPGPPSGGGTPDKVPFDIPYGTDITGDRAKELVAAVETEVKNRGWKMSIAVVDTHGGLVAFLRMDGAMLGSIDVAPGKARMAVLYRRETRAFYNAFETGHPYIGTLPGMIAIPGGFPLNEGGKIIGAIGCSGGTGDQDAASCKVGADMVK